MSSPKFIGIYSYQNIFDYYIIFINHQEQQY